MMTIDDAKRTAMAKLCAVSKRAEDELAFLEHLSVRKPYGWVLFYNTRRYVETGDPLSALGGNGPVVVLEDGEVHLLGSARTPADTIAEFEAQRAL